MFHVQQTWLDDISWYECYHWLSSVEMCGQVGSDLGVWRWGKRKKVEQQGSERKSEIERGECMCLAGLGKQNVIKIKKFPHLMKWGSRSLIDKNLDLGDLYHDESTGWTHYLKDPSDQIIEYKLWIQLSKYEINQTTVAHIKGVPIVMKCKHNGLNITMSSLRGQLVFIFCFPQLFWNRTKQIKALMKAPNTFIWAWL